MKILVVGASTFLGAPLATNLAKAGHDVSILHPDPRRADPAWLANFRCHFGTCRNGHVLHEALEGVERVVALLASRGNQGELEETRDLAAAASQHGIQSLVKVTTPAPLRNAPWEPMRTRRHADQILDGTEVPTCLAEIGWIGEALSHLAHKNRLWLPHPVSCPGKLRWQSRRMAVERLTELSMTLDLPRRAKLIGNDHATLAEITSRLVASHPRMSRVFLPGRAFRWLERLSFRPAFVGCRLVYGAKESDPAPVPGILENAMEDW